MCSRIIISCVTVALVLLANLQSVHGVTGLLGQPATGCGCHSRGKGIIFKQKQKHSHNFQHFLEGKPPNCNEFTTLPLNQLLNPVLKIPCDLMVCLLNITCERQCKSPIINLLYGLGYHIVGSCACDDGLHVCPDKDILHLEECIIQMATNLLT